MINLLWVPLPVLQKALIEKNHREITIFLYLKMTTPGRVKIEGRKKKEILQMLSISSPILYRRLKRLRKWNWVGYDEAKRVYYIRGFKYLYEKEGFKSRTTVRIKIHDLFHLQAFAFSASLGYLLRAQSRWKWRGAEQKTRCSKQSPATIFKPVSLSVMESFFSLSQDTLIKLKNHSIREGYLTRERGYKELFSASDYHPGYYDAFPEHWGRLRKIKTTTGLAIVLIESDKFIDHHWYKRKRYK